MAMQFYTKHIFKKFRAIINIRTLHATSFGICVFHLFRPCHNQLKMFWFFPLCSALREASITALSGQRIHGSIETALTATFELLNLVPADQLNPLKSAYNQEKYDRHSGKSGGGADATERDHNKRLAVTLSSADNSEVLSKWRRVGSVSGSSVRLDTIIWPGGDIVVSGEWCLRCNLLLSQVLFELYFRRTR